MLFDGMAYVGAPVLTLVRGRIVMQDRQVVGAAGGGMFIPRMPPK
jgi:dihydroorotase-like cyclic amidohydrolase